MVFLGTGAACGVPSFYCGCKACEEALCNPRAARSCSSLLVSGKENVLIDAGPDLRTQLPHAGVSTISRLLLTHGHFDHVGGIPQLEFYSKLKTKAPVPVYASSQTARDIEGQYAFMADNLEMHVVEAWDRLEFDNVSYTALPAAHTEGSFGFLIETLPGGQDNEARQSGQPVAAMPGRRTREAQPTRPCGKRIAYFPDTGPLSAEVLEALADLDMLIIDATFNGANWMPESHHSIDEALALAQRLGPGKTWLTHLSMHYDTPITMAELDVRLAPLCGKVDAAYDMMTLAI